MSLCVLNPLKRGLIDLLNDCKNVQQIPLGICELLFDQEVIKLLLVHLNNLIKILGEFNVFLFYDFIDLILSDLKLLFKLFDFCLLFLNAHLLLFDLILSLLNFLQILSKDELLCALLIV